jgi:phosphoglycerate dehydrogenase-like enzyme
VLDDHQHAASLVAVPVTVASDVRCLHIALMPHARGLTGWRELSPISGCTVVVNVGRGDVVNKEAVADLLETGRFGGAGLDLFEAEPLPRAFSATIVHIMVVPLAGRDIGAQRDQTAPGAAAPWKG